jgi:hypothetical protein
MAGVIGEMLDVLAEAAAVKPLDRVDDAAMDVPTPLAEQALIGDVLGERVLEDVAGAIGTDALIEQLTAA